MSLIFSIVTLCVFATCCHACEYDDPNALPELVLAKQSNGDRLMGNFHFAFEYCKSNGMNLVTPDTKEKNDALLLFIKDIGSVWTSGSDLAKEGTFVWMTNGLEVTFSDWSGSQPDNAGTKEHCLEIRYPFHFKWNDFVCDALNAVVCERGPAQLRTC